MQQATGRMRATEHWSHEGPLTGAMDAIKVPSDAFLWAAMASIATSMTLQAMGRKQNALFVGQWAPTFLTLALYNKLTKSATDRGF